VSELKFNLPWPPSINSMYSQGIIGGRRNLEEALVDVLDELAEKSDTLNVAHVRSFAKSDSKVLRAIVREHFGSPRASMFLSDAGKAYRDLARTALIEQCVPKNALHGRLEVSVIAYPPDARLRDLSNLWKSALDILQHNEIIANDGHFDRESIERGPERKGGVFAVTLREISSAFESRQQGFDLAVPQVPRVMSGKAPF
jgi:crossover junction endodeoxyribonuclease RusA